MKPREWRRGFFYVKLKRAMINPFASIIGHVRQTGFLAFSAAKGSAVHAYLFEGVEHLGKAAIGEIFSSLLLNVPYSGHDNLIKHPDFLFLELGINSKTGKQKKNIGIDEVRDLIHRLSLSSFSGTTKVAMIAGAENLSTEAANAMLKTLEEPKGRTHIILVASSKEALPSTIVSRTQVLRFSPVSRATLAAGLEARGVGSGSALAMSSIAFGRPGLAINMNENLENFSVFKKELAQDLKICTASILDRIKRVEKIAPPKATDAKERVERTLDRFELIFRDMLGAKLGVGEARAFGYQESELALAGSKYSPGQIVLELRNIGDARNALSENVSPKFVLEHFFINL